MAEIYVIEGTKEVLKTIWEPIPLIRRGWKKLLNFLNNFLNMNYCLNTHYFFTISCSHSKLLYIYIFLSYRRGTSWLKKIKTSLATVTSPWASQARIGTATVGLSFASMLGSPLLLGRRPRLLVGWRFSSPADRISRWLLVDDDGWLLVKWVDDVG